MDAQTFNALCLILVLGTIIVVSITSGAAGIVAMAAVMNGAKSFLAKPSDRPSLGDAEQQEAPDDSTGREGDRSSSTSTNGPA